MLRAAALALASLALLGGAADDPPATADEAYRQILGALRKKAKTEDPLRAHALARPLLVDFVDRFPDAVQRPELLELLAEFDVEARRFDDAAASLERYLADYPAAARAARVRASLAEALCFAGRDDDALAAARAIDGDGAPSATGGLAVVEVLRLLGRPEEARAAAGAARDALGAEHPLAYAFDGALEELAWVGREFPAFAFAPHRAPGEEVVLADLRGAPVLVDLWASWCGPCVTELPNRLDVHARYAERGYRVVGVSLDESAEALGAALARWELPWPQHFDGRKWDTPLAVALGVDGLPASFLLDADGVVRAVAPKGYALEHHLRRLLEG